MSRLFVRFASAVRRVEEDLDADIHWLILADDRTSVAEGHARLAALSEVVEAQAPWADDPENVVVLVPTTDVLAITCAVPGRNASQIQRAVPYAVEEFVAEDIDTMHVACARVVRNEPVRCLVTPRRRVEDWLEAVTSAGIAPGFMTADAMALADVDHTVSVLFDGESALLRAQDQIAGVDRPNMAAILAFLRPSLGEKPTLRQINGELPGHDLSQSGFTGEETVSAPVTQSLLNVLAGEFNPDQAINLLQGGYAVRHRPKRVWALWRPVAAAAGVWLAIGLAFLAAQGFWANHHADRLRGEAAQLYRDVYKVERVVGNPADRMRRQLGQAPVSSTEFHELVGQLGLGLHEVAGRHEVRRLQYSARRGLDAELVVDNDAVLEELGSTLRGQDLGMEILSTDSDQPGGRIGAKLRVASAE